MLLFKNHFVFIKKFTVFLGNLDKNFSSRRCVNFYTNEHMLMIQKPEREINETTTIRTSSESHKTTYNIYKQTPVCNGFYIVSEFEDVFQKVSMNIHQVMIM